MAGVLSVRKTGRRTRGYTTTKMPRQKTLRALQASWVFVLMMAGCFTGIGRSVSFGTIRTGSIGAHSTHFSKRDLWRGFFAHRTD